jgi:transposase InsO family protein
MGYRCTMQRACEEFKMVLSGEGSLCGAVEEFVAHYNRERNHQALGNQIIHP